MSSQDSFLSFLGKRPRSESFDSQYTRIEDAVFSPFGFTMPSQYSQSQAAASQAVAKPGVRRMSRKAYTKTKGKAKITPALRRAVKQVVNSQAETKRVQYNGTLALGQINSATTQAQLDSRIVQFVPQGTTIGAIACPYPEIREGTAQNQRVGDKVMIKGQYFRYTIVPQPYNATTNPFPRPMLIQMWLIQPVTGMQDGLPIGNIQSTNAQADFFETTLSGDSGLAGNFLDFHLGIDKENYRVLATARHKLGYTGNLNSADVPTILNNNDFEALVQGQMKIPAYALNFDRQDRPQKQPIYLVTQLVAQNQVAFPSAQIPAIMWFNLDTFYTDM